MLEIFDEERAVLNLLIHPEYLPEIAKEVNLSLPVIIDITRQLLHYGYIKALDDQLKPSLGFDVDRILTTPFQLTSKGYDALMESR
jgi:hypothetical protein